MKLLQFCLSFCFLIRSNQTDELKDLSLKHSFSVEQGPTDRNHLCEWASCSISVNPFKSKYAWWGCCPQSTVCCLMNLPHCSIIVTDKSLSLSVKSSNIANGPPKVYNRSSIWVARFKSQSLFKRFQSIDASKNEFGQMKNIIENLSHSKNDSYD